MSEEVLTDASGRNSLDPRSAPVGIPPASFDIDDLKEKLENAVALDVDAPRELLVGDAIVSACATPERLAPADRAEMPGFIRVDVEHPELGVVESVQVYAGAADAEAPPSIPVSPPVQDSAGGSTKSTKSTKAADAAKSE